MWLKLRNTVGPLSLILLCPPTVMLIWYTNTVLGGSLYALGNLINQHGLFHTIYGIWQPYFWGSSTAWEIIFIFVAVEVALMRLLPGKIWHGPITPKGNTPVYKANGIFAFVTSISLFCMVTFGLKLFPASILYDNLGHIFGALNVLSLVFCVLLYFKGRFYPSSTDSGITKNMLFDFFWGTELYPKVGSLSIKKFITCRFGMMSWGLLLISYCAKQAELGGLANSMLVSVALQLLYIAKFYAWEHGYLRSLDIMHDRAGFYICWGCMVWVPCIYTSTSMYLVNHPIHLSNSWAFVIFGLGTVSIMINYFADKQRLLLRKHEGKVKIWGKQPVTLLVHYETEQGDKKQNILLASGWWGIARHFHYIPEISGSLFWALPALFEHILPYFYVIYLTILLLDRANRDDKRCATKYGQGWARYCELVPYKIIPFLI